MTDETERLTYRQLAERLGLSIDAARARVRRGKWLKITDNSGTVRVTVPASALHTPDVQDELPSEQAEAATPNGHHTESLNALALSTLRDALNTLETELNRRAAEVQEYKATAGKLQAENTELREQVAKLTERLAIREQPTDKGHVHPEQPIIVQPEHIGQSWLRKVFRGRQ